MKFHRADTNSNFRALRLLSEGGCWELGMSPYSHGMRLRMGAAGRPPQVMDFCMGRDETLFPRVLVAVIKRLEPLDERSSVGEIDAAFPWSGTRPDLAEHLDALLDPPNRSSPAFSGTA
ncbi:MAG: hypothetical protein V4689_06845 [Verrucomicrobiota bacterium]